MTASLDPRITGAKILRPSLAETWSQCQERARAMALVPENVSIGEPADIGAAFHSYAADFLHEDDAAFAEAETRKAYPLHIAQEAIALGRAWHVDAEQLAFTRYGKQLQIERPMWAELRDGWWLRGTLDAAWLEPDGTIAVRDWKTHRDASSLEKPHNNPQLRLYAYLAALAMGGDRQPDVVVSHCFVRYRGEASISRYALTWAEAMGGKDIAQDICAQMDRAAAQGAPEAYQASPGPICGYCFAAPKCWARGRALMSMPGLNAADLVAADPVRAAELYQLAGAVQKLLKERLEAHVTANGPLRVGDRVLSFTAQPRLVFEDLPALGKTLKRALGPDNAWSAFSASKTSVSDAMALAKLTTEQRAELWREVEKAARRTISSRFEWRKADASEQES